MDMGYSAAEVISRFNSFDPVLIVSYAITLACFVIYYIAAIIKGLKDQKGGMPWQTNMWNISNDFCFVFLGFSLWWMPGLVTNHWFTHIIWVGMVLWFAAEFITHFQTMKWDLHEIFPHAKSKRNAVICYIAVQVGVVGLYYWLWYSINDSLVQIMIASTVVGCTLFVPELLAVRGSTKGISAWSLWSVLVAQIAWWLVCLPSMSSDFNNVFTYFFGICACGFGTMSLVRFYQLRSSEKDSKGTESADASDAGSK